MPALYNFLGENRVWRGNHFPLTFRFKNADASAVDLTGSTIHFRAVDSAGAEVVNAAMTVATPATGEATLTLTPSQTVLFTAGSGNKYEVERRISGVETTLVYGNITADGGINTNA